jgi:hypothetical protein
MLKPDEEGVFATSLRVSPWMLANRSNSSAWRFPSRPRRQRFSTSAKPPSFTFFSAKPTEPAAFEIVRIEADKQPLTLFKADGFLPFVDRFGQFAHDDWPARCAQGRRPRPFENL